MRCTRRRTCCAAIHRFGGYYVLQACANQPTLEEDLRLFFSEPPLDCRDWRLAHTCSKGHGRVERRALIASTELNEWRASTWQGVEQVFCIQRTRSRQGQRHTQTVSGITNLSPLQASAAQLLELVRRHWTSENRLRLSPGCDPGRRSLSGPHRRGPAGPGGPQHGGLGPVRFSRGAHCSASRCAA
jgi:hypothetical protein